MFQFMVVVNEAFYNWPDSDSADNKDLHTMQHSSLSLVGKPALSRMRSRCVAAHSLPSNSTTQMQWTRQLVAHVQK